MPQIFQEMEKPRWKWLAVPDSWYLGATLHAYFAYHRQVFSYICQSLCYHRISWKSFWEIDHLLRLSLIETVGFTHFLWLIYVANILLYVFDPISHYLILILIVRNHLEYDTTPKMGNRISQFLRIIVCFYPNINMFKN